MSKASDSVAGRLAAMPDVLFVRDIAAVLRCSPWTVRRRIRAGVFAVPPLPGVDKRLRFSRAAFERWLGRGGAL